MQQKVKVNGKTINVRLDKPYIFGNGFESFVKAGFKKGYTKGNFRSKSSRNIIGVWFIDTKEKSLLEKFINRFS